MPPTNDFLNPYAHARMPQEREELIGVFIPSLMNRPGTLLYVGAAPGKFACGKLFHEAGHEITVLEIWPPYVEAIRNHEQMMAMIRYVVEGDVRRIDKIKLPHEQYDYVVWWRGPEHIERGAFERTVAKLEALATQIVMMSTPWGWHSWPAEDHNPHMEHVSYYYPKDYARLGYRVVAVWPEDEPGSHIMAWKRLQT